jgi:hypothetical protein
MTVQKLEGVEEGKTWVAEDEFFDFSAFLGVDSS